MATSTIPVGMGTAKRIRQVDRLILKHLATEPNPLYPDQIEAWRDRADVLLRWRESLVESLVHGAF